MTEQPNNNKNQSPPIFPEYQLEATLNDYQAFADYLITFDEYEKAWKQLKFLPKAINHQSPNLAKQKPEIWQGYQEVLFKLKAVCLMFLGDNEVLELLKTRAVDLLKLTDYYFADKLKAKLIMIRDIDERDAFKAKVRQALEECQQTFSEVKLTIGQQTIEPTLANWLKDYLSVVGPGPAETIKKAEFFTTNANVQKLAPEEKEFLHDLVEIYEKLKISSQEPEGLEEVISFEEAGKHYVMRQGIIEEIKPDPLLEKIQEMQMEDRLGLTGEEEMEEEEEELEELPAASLSLSGRAQDLFKQYKKLTEDLFANAQVKTHLQALAGLSVAEIIKKLTGLTAKDESSLVLACLFSLIQQKGLPQLEGDASFKEWQANFLKNYPGLVAINLTNPAQRQLIMAQFIKMVLEERAKLGAQASAMAFMHLANLAKAQGQPEYLAAAYADLKTASFNWRAIEVVEGKLKYK